MSETRTLEFKAQYWSYEETDDSELNIYVGGLTEKQETVLIKVVDFTPFVYLQLPTRMKWNTAKCKALFQYFQDILKNDGPKDFSMYRKYLLLHKKLVNTMFLSFPTSEATKKFANRCKRGSLNINGVGSFRQGEFKVHEHNIDPIIKFTASKKISLAGWIRVTETIPEDEEDLDLEERRFTTADIDMIVNWNDVTPIVKENVITRPKYISFDGEMYSENHNSKIPNPDGYKNKIFHLANAVGRENDPLGNVELYLFTLFNPLDIPEVELIEGVEGRPALKTKNVHIIRCKTEKDLIIKWAEFVRDQNPDIFIGYNIMKFDWHYIITRAEVLGIYLKVSKILGRILGQKAQLKSFKWGSSAYGNQEFKFFDTQAIQVDVLIEVERNYKMSTYSLNAVSEKFLQEHKKDITHFELFFLYQITLEFIERLSNGELLNRKELHHFRQRVKEIMLIRKVHGDVKKYRSELLRASPEDLPELIRKAMWLTGVYAFKDVVLPIRLMGKLKLWTSMEAMSNCMHVPMSYLHTRGQQIKVLAQVYRETLFNDIVIPYHEKNNSNDDKFQGAIVIKAVPGDYENVACLDFASLYPSMIIAYNICHTTLVDDKIVDGSWGHSPTGWFIPDPSVSDDDCHVLDWWDHQGCSHDPQNRKKKKEDVLCRHHRYRFKKVKVLPDGTRIGEGLIPRLERNLLAARKEVKKEMFKLEARLKMQRGGADQDDLKYYKDMGWEIIEAGSLTKQEEEILEVNLAVKNANQLAIKVSANSIYGALGARTGAFPIIPGAASTTAMGRFSLMEVVKYLEKHWKHADVVYGDTDSVMPVFQGRTREEAFDDAEQSAAEISHFLRCQLIGVDMNYTVNSDEGELKLCDVKPKHLDSLTDEEKVNYYKYSYTPITLEFENMYGRFFQLTKKRYVAYVVNREGAVISVTKKGVVLARRDNCAFLRKSYKLLIDAVLDKKDRSVIMNSVYDSVHSLFTRHVPDKDYIIYVGVKEVMSYANKREIVTSGGDVRTVYLDKNKEPIDDPIGPLDRRLVYRNIPQALLALKMLRRGEEIPPNTRFEFLYCENEDAQHQGEKAEDYTFYRENRHDLDLRPDPLHYLEKQFSKPANELLSVKFPREEIAYDLPQNAFDRHLEDLYTTNELVYRRVLSQRGIMRKVRFVIECSKQKTGAGRLRPSHPLVEASRRILARDILDRLHSQYGMKKRPTKRPTKSGDKLPPKTSIMTLRDMKKMGNVYPVNSRATVVEWEEKLTGRKREYFYKIMMEDGTVFCDVPRKNITTHRPRDGKIMKDMLDARIAYKNTVAELKKMFEPKAIYHPYHS